MQSNVAKKELKRQSKIKESTRASITADAAEFNKNNKNSQWVEDTSVKKCMRCEKKFTLTVRRHHCRECGGIFCDSCSSRKLIINGQLKRACENCYESVVSGKNKSLGPVTFPTALAPDDPNRSSLFRDNLHDSSLSPRPSSLMRSVKDGDSPLPIPQYPWVKALLLIRSLGRNNTDKPEIDSCFPEVLPEEMLNDIIHIAMPNELNKERESLEFNFTFRIDPTKYEAKKSAEETGTDGGEGERGRSSSSGSVGGKYDLLYGFVLYRQKQLYIGKDATRTSRPICQSLVMISEVPIPYLAYRFLTNLEEALFHILSISSAMKQEKESTEEQDQSQLNADSTDRSVVKEEVNRALQVGVNMISSWPPVELSEEAPILNLALPLLGEVVQFSINLPAIIPRHLCSIPDPFQFSKMSLGSSVTYSSGTNLISQFGPYGLLPHLWVLWELLVQGKNIVVLSHFADACSEMVIALSSLVISSSHHYRGGAVYPYISRHNKSEVHRIAVEAKSKKLQMEENEQSLRPDQSPSTIVGITDPSLLQDFRHFSVLVILSPKISEQEGERGGSSPSHVMKKSVALQKSIDSIHTLSGNNQKTPLQKLADESIVKYNAKFASPLKTASDFEVSATKESPAKVSKSKVGIFAKGFIHWKRSKDVSGANAPPAYVIIQSPSSSISFPNKLQERVCSRLQKLSKRDYLVLGDRILRDHFNEMSERIFEPLPADEKMSNSPQKASADRGSGSRSSNTKEEDEYEEVEVEVEVDEPQGGSSTGSASPSASPGPLSTALKVLKSNHDKLQISTFRNFVAIVLGCVLLLLNKLISFPPLWMVVLIMTAYFAPSSESFDNFVTDQTAGGAAPSKSSKKKIKKTIRRKKVKADASTSAVVTKKTDYSGVWKRTKVVNFEAFAAAQGAGYVQRKLAASIEMIVTITMDAPHCTTVRIQEDGGPIHSDNTMVIGGEPSEAPMGAKIYADRASWENGVLKLNKVFMPNKEYELEVYRHLEDNGQSIRQMQTFIDLKSGKRVESQAYFTRTGNSPNAPPPSTFPPGEEAPTVQESAPLPKPSESTTTEAETGRSEPKKADFSGVWSRFKSHNMDQYAGALGAGYVQRKLAGSIAMVHTITMNPPALNAFRLQEVGGPVKNDTLYTIDATESIETKLGNLPHMDMVEWKESVTAGTLLEAMPSPGPTLVITKTPVNGDHIVYQGRYLEDDKTLVVVNIHYNQSTSVETIATNWFKLTGPSPNLAPEPQLPIKGSTDSGNDTVGGHTSEVSASSSSRPERQASTSSLRVDFSGVWERQTDNTEKMMSSVMQSHAGVMNSTHTITMDAPTLSTFQIVETSSKTNVERNFQIGGDAIEVSQDDKTYKEKCYWLGEALVVQRLSVTNDVEIVITRFLEKDRMRLVTVRKNLHTGDNTESVSFFTKRPSDS